MITKKAAAAFCCLSASLLLLTGCQTILEREFVIETAHVSTNDSETPQEVVELSGYDDLKSALLALIEKHTLVQTLRLTDYGGNVELDVRRVVREVMKSPIAAFAVNNISYQSSQILSYYEIKFDISYRRPVMDIEAIQKLESSDELAYYLEEKMEQFSTTILFQLTDYDESLDFPALFQSIYYENPQLAYGYTGLDVHLYPDSGANRIVEFTVEYSQSPETLAAKSATATDEAQLILDAYQGSLLTANRLFYFHDTLVSTVGPDLETAALLLSGESIENSDPFTVYGALIKKTAVSEGFALAFRQLCDMSGIECLVVSGKKDGVPHYWNLVNNRGEWSHVDTYTSALNNTDPYAGFGLTDEDLQAHYTWDKHLYPASSTTLLRDMLSAELSNKP